MIWRGTFPVGGLTNHGCFPWLVTPDLLMIISTKLHLNPEIVLENRLLFPQPFFRAEPCDHDSIGSQECRDFPSWQPLK